MADPLLDENSDCIVAYTGSRLLEEAHVPRRTWTLANYPSIHVTMTMSSHLVHRIKQREFHQEVTTQWTHCEESHSIIVDCIDCLLYLSSVEN
jgi:hypothetical protein